MLLENSIGVLHRHFVASEWQHARAKLSMQMMQRGALGRSRGLGCGHDNPGEIEANIPLAPANERARRRAEMRRTGIRAPLIRPDRPRIGAPSVLMPESVIPSAGAWAPLSRVS